MPLLQRNSLKEINRLFYRAVLGLQKIEQIVQRIPPFSSVLFPLLTFCIGVVHLLQLMNQY